MSFKVNEEVYDIKNENIKALIKLFPTVFKDGQIDFKALKEELGEFEETKEEKFELTWAGKQNAKKKFRENVGARTLKYIEKDSKDSETTKNLYIEGDNLEVLKLLHKNYYGSIKMIYIDPPYNTGNDFVYKDNFKQNKIESDKQEGTRDEEGNRLEQNNKSSNKYHANWLNMMYPRLKVARDLLTDDGIIFISIDSNEHENLKKLCDELFFEENFIGDIIPIINPRGSQSSKDIAVTHEYILVYRKTQAATIKGLDLTEEQKKEYNKKDEKGYYREIGLRKRGADSRKEDSPTMFFPIFYNLESKEISLEEKSDWIKIIPKLSDGSLGRWRWGREKVIGSKDELLVREVKRKEGTEYDIFQKDYFGEDKKRKVMSLWNEKEINNEFATELIKELFNEKVFDYTKSVFLLLKLLKISVNENDTILDFFSGSATTAHAVMQLNAEDGGNRKYIMVQLPEEVNEKSEAYNFLEKNKRPFNICEIGKERIRRAGELIKKEIEENNTQLKLDEVPKKIPDIGFKVFKTADTNINWKKIRNISKENVLRFDEPDILDFTLGSNDIDIIYEVLLRQRDLPLSEKLVKLTDIGDRTYLYADSYLICLETKITRELVECLAELNPLPIKFVFRDSAFGSQIGLKEETFRYLRTLIERNLGITKKAYTVEFI